MARKPASRKPAAARAKRETFTKPPITIEDRLAHGSVSVPEYAAYCVCSLRTAYADIASGRVASFKQGGRRRIPGTEIYTSSVASAPRRSVGGGNAVPDHPRPAQQAFR